MSVINLGRTTKGNIVFYSSDGMGRDGYITYNDGGFWKDNIRQITLKPDYPKNNYKIFHSLNHQAAPFNYYSDGSGRDSYVIQHNGGLVKHFEPMAKQKLSNFLRNENSNTFIKRKIFLTKSQKNLLSSMKKRQDNVVKRLYNSSIEKMKNNNKFHTKSLSGYFNNNYINNLDHISPIKNYNIKEPSFNKYKENRNNNNKFLNPMKENGEKNLFNKILKNRNISKNNSMKNITYIQTRDNTGKVKILNNQKINSSSISYKFNNSLNNFRRNENNMIMFKKIDNNNKKRIINNKNYKVVVGKDDLYRKKNFMKNDYSCNNTFNDINITNNITDRNYNDDKFNDNMKYKLKDNNEEKNLDINNEIYKYNFNRTQIFNKEKPFLVDNFKDFYENNKNYRYNNKDN